MIGSLTTIHIDGNSVGTATGACADDGTLELAHLAHGEATALFEVARRVRHPVFMDVTAWLLTDKQALTETIRATLPHPDEANPVAVVMPGDKVRVSALEGPADEAMARRRRLLTDSRSINPLDFPAAVRIDELPLGDGRWRTRLVRMRLADLIPLVELLRSMGYVVESVVPAHAALEQIGRLMGEAHPGEPLGIIDIGKLRTAYSIAPASGAAMAHHVIPVGLARDDQSYFTSLPLTVGGIASLVATQTALLLSADSTPLPILSVDRGTPQLEATRMALQVGRFAGRALEASLGGRDSSGGWPGVYYIAGRGSRMPGLRQYLEARLRTRLRRVDRRPLPRITLPANARWADVADCLAPVGALIALAGSEAPVITLAAPPLPMPAPSGTVEDITPGVLYVLEQGGDVWGG
jgi:hypothetical protein